MSSVEINIGHASGTIESGTLLLGSEMRQKSNFNTTTDASNLMILSPAFKLTTTIVRFAVFWFVMTIK